MHKQVCPFCGNVYWTHLPIDVSAAMCRKCNTSIVRGSYCAAPTCRGCGAKKDEDDGKLCSNCQEKKDNKKACDDAIDEAFENRKKQSEDGVLEDPESWVRERHRIQRRFGIEED